MLGIKLIERSLLWGYSIHWCIIQGLFPTIELPDIWASKNKHILVKIPSIGGPVNEESRNHWSKNRYVTIAFKVYRLYMLISFGFYYLALIIFILRLSGTLLPTFGITDGETLSYKSLYYTPILHKAGMLLTIALMFNSSGAKEWHIYDKYKIFNVSERMQTKLFCMSYLAGIADGIFAHYEALSLVLFGPTMAPFYTRFIHGQYFSNETIIGFIVNSCPALTVLLCYTVRYKPLLNKIYAALCISHHMEFLNKSLEPLSRSVKESSSNRSIQLGIESQEDQSAGVSLDIEHKSMFYHNQSTIASESSLQELSSKNRSSCQFRDVHISSYGIRERQLSKDSRAFLSDSRLDLLSTRPRRQDEDNQHSSSILILQQISSKTTQSSPMRRTSNSTSSTSASGCSRFGGSMELFKGRKESD